MRGRKPKPTRLKILNGNPGCRPLNENEPTPRAGAPSVPGHLDDEAKKEWKRVSKELAALGLLTRLDRAAFAAYCAAYSRWAAAERQVKQFGTVLSRLPEKEGDPPKFYTNPYLHVANQAMEKMHSFASEFGLTPSSRTRIQVAPRGAADPFEQFVNERKQA